jgi:hypothetical protein
MPSRTGKRLRGLCVAAAVAASARVVAADPAPPPSDDFLAYLGSWEGDDEDWRVLLEAMGAENARSTSAPSATNQARRAPAEGGAKPQEKK